MKYFKKIEGKEVYLSPMNIEDVEIYTKWLNDFSVTDGLGMSARVTTLSNEREFINNNTINGTYQFAIIDKETDKLIGNGGYSSIDHLRQTGELGLFIGDEDNRDMELML